MCNDYLSEKCANQGRVDYEAEQKSTVFEFKNISSNMTDYKSVWRQNELRRTYALIISTTGVRANQSLTKTRNKKAFSYISSVSKDWIESASTKRQDDVRLTQAMIFAPAHVRTKARQRKNETEERPPRVQISVSI